jgi:hypothetical protein
MPIDAARRVAGARRDLVDPGRMEALLGKHRLRGLKEITRPPRAGPLAAGLARIGGTGGDGGGDGQGD